MLIPKALLAPFSGGNYAMYKCAADVSTVKIGAKLIPRVRTFSMSQCVGTDPSTKNSTGPIGGPWLDGSHGHTANKVWYCYGKTSDVIRPAPSNLWIFMDEDDWSINDAGLAIMGPPKNGPASLHWIDAPGSWHNGACGIAFADGHSEVKKWKTPRDIDGKLKPDGSAISGAPFTAKDKTDITWISDRTSALINP